MRRARITALIFSFLMILMSAMPVYAGTWTRGDDETWSYVNDDGETVTGWIEDGEKTYYLEDNGKLRTGWYKSKGSWYYFDEDGVLVKDTWIDNYYVNTEGKLKGIK